MLHHVVAAQAAAIPARNSAEDRIKPRIEGGPQAELEKMSDRDPLYLLLCQLEWRYHQNLAAYGELVAALDDRDPIIRELAQILLHRVSPRPKSTEVKRQNPWVAFKSS